LDIDLLCASSRKNNPMFGFPNPPPTESQSARLHDVNVPS
jgi:hypothetical protein